MFPLAGKSFPEDADELAESIRTALEEFLTFPKGSSGVTVDAPKYPTVKQLTVDLDDARAQGDDLPPKPVPKGKREPGIKVGQLEITGHPIRYEKSKVDLSVKAKNVAFDFARDKKGKPLLVLSEAGEGQVAVKVAKADMQALAQAAATLAAKEHGVTIQEVELTLESRGPRAVAADARVKAKKMLVSGVLHIKGRLDIDEELNATISELDCQGEGIVGTMAAAVIQPKLAAVNGKKIALVAFSFGDVTLRDLKIDVKSGLNVTARFG
jgi:hypothetical protein